MKTKIIGNLEWQAEVPAQRFSWAQAVAYGFSLGPGWRLPTHAELLALVDNTQRSPACSVFPDTPWESSDDGEEAFWTSNQWWMPEKQMSGVYVIDFWDGGTAYLPNDYAPLRVRCVREVKL